MATMPSWLCSTAAIRGVLPAASMLSLLPPQTLKRYKTSLESPFLHAMCRADWSSSLFTVKSAPAWMQSAADVKLELRAQTWTGVKPLASLASMQAPARSTAPATLEESMAHAKWRGEICCPLFWSSTFAPARRRSCTMSTSPPPMDMHARWRGVRPSTLLWCTSAGNFSRIRATHKRDLWMMAVCRGVKPELFFMHRTLPGAERTPRRKSTTWTLSLSHAMCRSVLPALSLASMLAPLSCRIFRVLVALPEAAKKLTGASSSPKTS
mmetsp:Transcript_19066/g.38130  ORF Transcript_19066/g.38130 Transcript_19066/m.38130 type:complete len:267 (+) Transcript_19066:516-1316(+)